MAYEQKDGQGALFKNDRKQGNGPDYKGDITVDGTAYWISAWLKESKGGKKYMSLAVTPKDEKRPSKKAQDEDSQIPF
jgi:hypothetical protein